MERRSRMERHDDKLAFYDNAGNQIGSNAYDLSNRAQRVKAYHAISSAYEAGVLTEGKYRHFVRTVEKHGPTLTLADRLSDSSTSTQGFSNTFLQDEIETSARLAKLNRSIGVLDYQRSQLSKATKYGKAA